MIFTAIFNLIYKAADFILTPILNLNDVPLNGSISSAIATASGYISSLSDYLPIGTIIAMLSLSVVIEGSYLGLKVINWGIRKIPTIS